MAFSMPAGVSTMRGAGALALVEEQALDRDAAERGRSTMSAYSTP
jgi:hypothetical protein